MNISKEQTIYKITLRIKDGAPLSESQVRLAMNEDIAQLNDSRYGYELTAKGEKIAGGGV